MLFCTAIRTDFGDFWLLNIHCFEQNARWEKSVIHIVKTLLSIFGFTN